MYQELIRNELTEAASVLQAFLAEMSAEFSVVETGGAQIALSLDDLPSQPTIMVLEPAYIDAP